MDSKKTNIIRICLALLLIVGIALGWLKVSGNLPFSDKLADAAETAELARQGEQLSLQLQDALNEQLAHGQAGENQQRLDSPMGQALLRQCLEWTEFHDNHPNDDTLQNRNAACTAYADYVEDGKEPK